MQAEREPRPESWYEKQEDNMTEVRELLAKLITDFDELRADIERLHEIHKEGWVNR